MADDGDLSINGGKMGALQSSRGLSFRAIAIFAAGLVLLLAASIVMLNSLMRYFETRAGANQPPPAASNIDANKVPPEPRLQDHAVQDLQQIRAAEDQILNRYEWVDQQKGVVRIPIDRAIDLLAQRGLPKHAVPGTQNKAGNVDNPAAAGLVSNIEQAGGPESSR